MKLSLFGVCQLVLAFNFGKFPNYLPKRTFETINAEKASQGSDIEIAKEALISRLEVKEDEFKFVRIDHGKNDVTYLYANRFIDGIKVSNEVASVVIKNGRLLAVSNTFSSSKKAPIGSQSRGFEISLGDAVSKAELEIGAKRDDYPASKVYLTGPDNNLKYCHQFQLRDQEKGIFCRVAVEIATGNVLQVIDYGMSFSINAVKFEDLDVSKGLSLLGNEVDKFASPLGWNSIGVDQSFSDTQGNNGISQHDGRLEDGGPNLDFDSEFNPEIEPSEPQNIRASVINAFYTINKLHDIFYHFGFTESAGNFQQTNFDKGGKGNDSVIVYIQPNTRKNNARFYTPPDGQRGELYLYLFDSSTPMRDSALEQLIIIHEFGHGVSKRLTGGSDSPDCTFAYTQNCLSEAWSDIFAFLLSRKGTETPLDEFVIGSYVTNKPNGIRMFPYSLDFKINPLTFKNVTTLNTPHDIGLIWGSVIFDLYWRLIESNGFSTNWYDSKQAKGNIILMNLIIATLKTQVCNPSFLDARNALLSADEQVSGGKYKCKIWQAFAARGMGIHAKEKLRDFVFDYEQVTESFKIPRICIIRNFFRGIIDGMTGNKS